MLAVLLALAGDAFRLTPETWAAVPGGKEVDAVYGDWLLRNDRVVAVIADAAPGRHAHLSLKHVQGAVIDFALRSTSNDQLGGFLPHRDGNGNTPQAQRIELLQASGPELRLRAVREVTEKDPVEATTDYVLRDGESFLRITTRYRNTAAVASKARLSDKMRCDQTFWQSPAGRGGAVVFHDRWFGAAYAVVRLDGPVASDGKFGGMFGPNGGTWIDYPDLGPLPPGGERRVERFLLVGRDAAELQAAAASFSGPKELAVVRVVDAEGRPLEGADVALRRGKTELSWARTGPDGTAAFLEGGELSVTVPGRAPKEALLGRAPVELKMGAASAIAFDVDGPCKVQFLGVETTPTPDFGPKQRAACGNLWHSATGRFTVPVAAGKYYLILSRGPEHDAAYRYVVVREGETAAVSARLPRTVDTRGWVSADFHNHATESGDNTTETESRLVCLAAEGVEFAPATEHNRIVSWKGRIRALGLEKVLATSDGMELTGNPLPLNHHNAFPLIERPRTQDGGGPTTEASPLLQLRKLLDHDAGAEKLLQQNHPDLGWLVYDADGDGAPDLGFGTLKFTDVVEIWRPSILSLTPTEAVGVAVRNHRTFNWLQLLNQGHRLPGVANTDAHYCAHESGRIRNWVKSSTDDPAAIDEMEMVRMAKKGRMVMSNGPFLEVSLDGALPGEERRFSSTPVLKVRVQCPNWLDIDRVQVLVNGRAPAAYNYTRKTHPGHFQDGVLKFDLGIQLNLREDAHVIVAAVGENMTCGPVMGQNTEPPTAISNPIWADVDGAGFRPNLDTLDAPLPVKK